MYVKIRRLTVHNAVTNRSSVIRNTMVLDAMQICIAYYSYGNLALGDLCGSLAEWLGRWTCDQ